MKINLILLLFTMASTLCLAQREYKHLYPGYYGNGSSSEPTGLRFGLKTGITQTDITRQLLVNPNLEDSYEPVFKPAVGLFVQYGITSNFIFGTGLNYRPMAIDYKTSSALETTTTTTKKNYIEMPLLLNVTWRKGTYKAYPAIYGGMSIAYLLNAKRDFERQTLTDNPESTSLLDIDVSDDFNNLDYGLSAGISYYIPVQTYLQIMLDLNGYIGLANINDFSADAVVRPNTVNRSISLSIGLLWGR